MLKKLTDIPPVSDFESQGKRISSKIYVLDEADVDYSKLPEITESESARSMASLTLKSSANGWKEINFAKYTAGSTSEGSQGDVTSTVNNSLTGTIGGESVAIDNFIESRVGCPVFVVTIDRFTRKKTIYGRPYSPMFLSAFTRRKNGENTSTDVTFSNESFFQPLEYLGEVTPPASDA